eukprot:g29694.t1
MLRKSVLRCVNCQDGLLRLLSELLQDVALGAEKASEEFMNFGLADQGGSEVVLQLMPGNLKNRTRVEAALFALAGAITHSPGLQYRRAGRVGREGLQVLEPCEVAKLLQAGRCLLVDLRDGDRNVGTINGTINVPAIKRTNGTVTLPFFTEMQKYANQWAKYPLVVLFCQHSADRAPQHAGWFKNHARQGQRMASEMGAKVLIQSVWRYWEEVDFRRRSLMLPRQIRDANHELTGFMLMHWKAHLAALELGQVKDPDEESKVEEAEESPAQPMDDPGPEEEPQADAPAEEEAAPEESPKMTHLDEGTLDMEVEVLKDMDDPRPGSSLSDLKSTPEVPDAPKQAELTKGVEATVEPFSGANLPREMRHFLALLRVHRFEQKSSILDIPDLVQAIVEFNDDADWWGEMLGCGLAFPVDSRF